VTILNSPSVSSSETGVRNGIKSWKSHLFSSAEEQETVGGFYFKVKNCNMPQTSSFNLAILFSSAYL
jgi:hypothetical protein